MRRRTPNCPQLFPEFRTGGVGPHGAARVRLRPRQPDPTKFPPYYDGAVFFGEFTRDFLREIRLDSEDQVFKINNLLNCGAVGGAPTPARPFECDNPMDLQFDEHGHFYLLTYGDGFFAINNDAGMYRWDYVKGQRAPVVVLTADADRMVPRRSTCSSRARDRTIPTRRFDPLRVGLRR